MRAWPLLPLLPLRRIACTLFFCAAFFNFSIDATAQTGPGNLVLSPTVISVSEGAGTLQLTVTRQSGSTGAIGVSFTTNSDTAIAGTDFTLTSGTLLWADGDAAPKTIDVPILQNLLPDGSRSFTVVLSNPTGGASVGTLLGAGTGALVTITDDEPETFPPGCARPGGWTQPLGANLVWGATTERKRTENCSLRATNDYGFFDAKTAIQTSGTYAAGNVSFYYNVLTPTNAACFRFYVDDVARSELGACGSSGGTGAFGDISTWTQVTVPVTAGEHTFKWSLEKISGETSPDRAWIDDVILPTLVSTTLGVRFFPLYSPPGSGSIGGPGFTCAMACDQTIAPGTVVTLVATPSPDSLSPTWTGCDTVVGNNCQVTMHASRSVFAYFPKKSYPLSINVTGTGLGAVDSSPYGIFDCRQQCTVNGYHGDVMTLTARPTNGFNFTGWSGACSGTGTCTVTMDAAKSVTATFDLPPGNFPLHLNVQPGGVITSNPAGISCGVACDTSYPQGAMVTLTAVFYPNYVFTGWVGGGCTGTALTCVVSMDAAKSVQATFAFYRHELAIQFAGSGSGEIDVYGPGGPFTCTTTCYLTFPHGAELALYPYPFYRNLIVNWGIAGCTDLSQCLFTLDSDTTITVSFDRDLNFPGPPTITSITPGNGTATVQFTPPAYTGTSPITSYSVGCLRASDNGGSGVFTGSASPIVTGLLVNDVALLCNVWANNAAGSGFPSASLPVTPSVLPKLDSVWSRKSHPVLGDRDIEIAILPAIDGLVSVEPRTENAAHRIVFRFDRPVTAVGRSTTNTGSVARTFNGNEVIVTLTGVPDNRRVTVGITGVNGGASAQASMGFLVGDVTGSRTVNAGDISSIKARIGQLLSPTNFRLDVDRDGSITAADTLLAKSRSGVALSLP